MKTNTNILTFEILSFQNHLDIFFFAWRFILIGNILIDQIVLDIVSLFCSCALFSHIHLYIYIHIYPKIKTTKIGMTHAISIAK